MTKKSFFFIDDVIWVFRDLTRGDYNSVFDHFFMKILKQAHDKYEAKIQLNVFYRTDYFYGFDEFTLSEMTDKYKKEFEEASDWRTFGFHAKQEFPDYPLINTSYEDALAEIKLTFGEIERFAGKNSIAKAVCPHWRPMSRGVCKALSECGIRLINSTAGETHEYNGDPTSLPYGHSMRLLHNRQPETKLFTRISKDTAISSSLCGYNHLTTKELEETQNNEKAIYKADTDCYYKQIMTHGVIINLSKLEEMEEEYKIMFDSTFVGTATHEQYFYPDYFAYQPDMAEKLFKNFEILAREGYTPIFAEELIK